ncbi:MAG: NAD-dependent protein deacylase [Christensenellales bacterium]|jgi:NAD-dependent deacetylase
MKDISDALSGGNIVFLGGAGVSTESGIPDFRGEGGRFKARSEFGFDPETMLSSDFFNSRPDVFFAYYKTLLPGDDIKPNNAHKALSKLEKAGKLLAVITQNIDGLHQKAGSKNVIELHGSMMRNYCVKCGERYGVERVAEAEGAPSCDKCKGTVRPDVVLYCENLDPDALSGAVAAVSNAQTLIVGGTSLQVYPAAGLINYYRGKRLVLINRERTPYDSRADLVIRGSIGEVLSAYA